MAQVLCSVPVFDPNYCPFDCVCLVKFTEDKQPSETIKLRKNKRGEAERETLQFEEVKHSRAYVNEDSNEDIYGKEKRFRWNAPELRINDFRMPASEKNFLEKNFLVSFKLAELEANTSDSPSGATCITQNGVTQENVLLYAPILTMPGFYSVRYCLDDTVSDEGDFLYGSTH